MKRPGEIRPSADDLAGPHSTPCGRLRFGRASATSSWPKIGQTWPVFVRELSRARARPRASPKTPL